MLSAKEQRLAGQLANRYNMLINLSWTAIFMLPAALYCYSYLPLQMLYVFIAISVLPVFLPARLFRKIHLFKSTESYHKTGIRFIKKFTQSGDLVNRLVKNKYPDYRVVSNSHSSVRKFLGRSLMYEKFHYLVFIFFFLVTIHALLNESYWYAAAITFTNVIYNIYPVLLQQYFHLRISASKINRPKKPAGTD